MIAGLTAVIGESGCAVAALVLHYPIVEVARRLNAWPVTQPAQGCSSVG